MLLGKFARGLHVAALIGFLLSFSETDCRSRRPPAAPTIGSRPAPNDEEIYFGKNPGGIRDNRACIYPHKLNSSMASLEVVTPSGQSLSDVLSRQALKELERGQAIPAVALLEEAVIEEPLNSAILNNLAAAHVAKAFSENSPIDLIYAFSAADKASVLNPRLMPASLNKSLVLHCLSLNWSDAGASQESIKRDLRAFSRDGQLERLAEAVSRYPRIARILAESDLLGEWAVARVQHQNSMAEEKLRTLMRIANSLRQATGDKFLEDVVHGLTRGGARVASGFILYYAGRQAYSVGDYDRAS
ncbi:MAG TPA: hypothetical protein VIE43_17005, partial [Thermoanaerobaculia bacterium]|nr:hypothetical protein [Thermoanaerobaculia bacterium]